MQKLYQNDRELPSIERLEEIARETFSRMSFYRDDDFLYIKRSDRLLIVGYISNHLSTTDGRSVDNMYCLVGEGGQTFVNFHIDETTKKRPFGKIHVREKHRDKNVGSQLIGAMEYLCREFGVERIITHSHCSPIFWQKMGYTFVNGEFEKEI